MDEDDDKGMDPREIAFFYEETLEVCKEAWMEVKRYLNPKGRQER